MKNFADYFDHTVLSPQTTPKDLKKVCEDAIVYGFHSVAVNTGMVELCASYLKGSHVKVDAAVGFPLGITTIACKIAEAGEAIRNGAAEVDYVVNIGKVKSGDFDYIREEMKQIVALCREKQVISKVIFENCYLTDEEKKALCNVALEVMPDYIKTSTGFGAGGATVEDVRLMKSIVGDKIRVKASGGIKSLETCLAMLDAGAERIGCSSSVSILQAYEKQSVHIKIKEEQK